MFQFDDLVLYFNCELFANCEKIQNVTYHTHRGFWKQQNGDPIEGKRNVKFTTDPTG